MSYIVEFDAEGTGDYIRTLPRFATEQEAKDYAAAVLKNSKTRVTESPLDQTHRIAQGVFSEVKPEAK